MAGQQERYVVPEGCSSPDVLSSDSKALGPLVVDGYGAEIVGYGHQPTGPKTALVTLPLDTRFKLRISNANNHLIMVKIDIDEVHVGTMLLNPFTSSDLERPLDRPLGFTFCVTEDETQDVKSSVKDKRARQSNKKPNTPERCNYFHRSVITCTFQPEVGAKTVELEVRAHQLDICKRFEMARSASVSAFFDVLIKSFGQSAADETCALIHWTNAEYDSPAEEVLTADMQTTLSNSVRENDPLRKMALLSMKKLEIHDEHGSEIVIDLTSVPRFVDVIESTQKDFAVGGPMQASASSPLYFLTAGGRLLGSTSWLNNHAFIFEVLHKDEILKNIPTLKLYVTSKPPAGIFSVFVRILKGGMFELQATKDTTLGELRFQLSARGGPWGDDLCWLFCGTLLETSKPLSHYGIRPRDTLDVLLRLQGHGSRTPVQEDPIAVEGEKPISSADLLSSATTAKRSKLQRRRGTTLKGRAMQQFIEVDPIKTDERFFETITLTLAPENEDFALPPEIHPFKGTSSGCHVM